MSRSIKSAETSASPALADAWRAKWNEAIGVWSPFTQLSPPRFCLNAADERREGLSQSFAMIRLNDHAVVISLPQVQAFRLQEFPLEIMCHEIGHHVFVPGDLSDQGRLIARLRAALPGRTQHAGLLANLYADFFINDRLKREHNLQIDEIYRRINPKRSSSRIWTLYMRTYELLWGLARGDLARGEIDARLEGDATLAFRLIRAYARDWLRGAGRFGALLYEYLDEAESHQLRKILRPLLDAEAGAAPDEIPGGLTQMDADEADGAIHPALDPELNALREIGDDETGAEGDDDGGESAPGARDAGRAAQAGGGGRGQARQPYEYGQILRQLGVKISDEEAARRYYREQAAPHLIPFPARAMPESEEPLPEGLDIWDAGSPVENIDWMESALRSPVLIPGFTTVERSYGVSVGAEPAHEPIDLDLYVDCSGSMPDPRSQISYLTLAGAIIALSALRVRSNVQATLWSGRDDVLSTPGFVSDETAILNVLCGYFGGGTQFPIPLLRETYRNRTDRDRKVHILVISDDGVTTMFDRDEQGGSGWDVARTALEKGGGGGTFVLNLYQDWRKNADLTKANEMGWHIAAVQSWEDLISFAREFSRRRYAGAAQDMPEGRR